MSALRFFIVLLVLICLNGQGVASDLQISIRLDEPSPHVFFGDPLYLEVTIVNRGPVPITGPPADLDFNTLQFKLYHPETELELRVIPGGGGLVGGWAPVVYQPGKPVKSYWMIFLPGLYGFEHPFWRQIRKDGRTVYISGVYYPERKVALLSEGVAVCVERRRGIEMQTLKRFANAEPGPPVWGPDPVVLGLQLKYKLDRDTTAELAATVKSGELGDLLQLAIRLQDIYAAAPDARDQGNRALVEWLKQQPDIKRQALTRRLRSIAASYHMGSTLEALQILQDDRD